MFHSLKAKLTFAFGTLIVILFAALGFFLIETKANELSEDIAVATQSFAVFAADEVVQEYQLQLEPGNFIAFTREISALLRKGKDISSVSLASYSGVILYDSMEEELEAYTGALRTIRDQETLDRVQSTKMTLLLEDGRILFVKLGAGREVEYVDVNEDPVEPLAPRDRIVDIMVPYQNAYSVRYTVDYSTLDARLAAERMKIGLMALVGVILALMISFMVSVSITNPLRALKEGALRIAQGDFTTRVSVKTRDEVGVLAQTFNKMAEDLAASTQAMLYQERVQKELELAAQIQTDLLPKSEVKLQHLDVSGGLIPATEIGGDAFDYIQMQNGAYLTYLGDVTGHGVAAGIVSSVANALFYAMRGETTLKAIAERLNEILQKKTSNKVFMTMALTLWNEETRTLNYVNAGHPPILYYDSAQLKVSDVRVPGVALGLLGALGQQITEYAIPVKPNDVVVLYSDGVPEAMNANGEQYGVQRLKRIVQDAANDLYTADGIKNAVLADVAQFMGNQPHSDDMTVVVLKGI